MTSQSAEAPPGSTEHGGLRLSPEAAYEVPVILQLTINSRVHVVGGVRKGLEQPANVMVLLGTKVSDGHPSCIGFRVLLRTETPKAKDSDSIEDHYHAVSCRFDPQGGKVTYAKVTSKDKEELMSTKPFRETFTEELKASTDQDLYHMRFITSDTNGFIISHHGPNLRSTDVYVRKIEKLMQFIAYASQLSMYFIADKILIKYLARTLKHDCVGTEAPSWKDALPDSSIIRWPSNVQTQMVSGSTDVLNVLLNAFREQPLRGEQTLVSYHLSRSDSFQSIDALNVHVSSMIIQMAKTE